MVWMCVVSLYLSISYQDDLLLSKRIPNSLLFSSSHKEDVKRERERVGGKKIATFGKFN
jgi:hypothetical protein